MGGARLMHARTTRPLTNSDVDTCVEIMRALPEWFGVEEAIRQYESDLRSLDGFVRLEAQRIVGFVGLKRYGDAAVEVNVIAVHPDYRNKGIGSSLLQTVENEAISSTTRLLHTKTVAPSRSNAAYDETRKFWAARGFVPMDEHALWGAENPCMVLVKPLR